MKKEHIKLFVFGILVLFVGYGGFVLYVSLPITFGNVDKAGTFGDSFGILTALFSGLAFAGIIYTITQQGELLENQKDDLKLTRDELELTRKELKDQNDTMKHQNFESTFFQMLRLHNEMVNSIDLRKKASLDQITSSGRDCFSQFRRTIQNNYKDRNPNDPEDARIENAYGLFWNDHRNDLGHYFRYLYTILKFIKQSDIKDKKKYSNIVRAQLSDQELFVIFYNCLYKHGVEKFKPLAEEFELFDNIPLEYLLKPEHRSKFSNEAFGSNSSAD